MLFTTYCISKPLKHKKSQLIEKKRIKA